MDTTNGASVPVPGAFGRIETDGAFASPGDLAGRAGKDLRPFGINVLRLDARGCGWGRARIADIRARVPEVQS